MISPKKGDWYCQCGILNFASRTNCFKCNKENNNNNKFRNDWKCECGYINYSMRKECFKCSKKKDTVLTDWKCGKCNELNFAKRVQCRKCSTMKNELNINPNTHNKKDDNENNDQELCCICLNNKKDMVIKKCGHVCMCKNCSLNINKCPMCRINFASEDLLKIFY